MSNPLDQHSQIECYNKWHIKQIIIIHIFLGIIITSFFFPKIPGIWSSIDLYIFQFFNQPLQASHFLRTFWMLANHSLADWVEDLCILGFYLISVYRTPKEKRFQKGCTFFFCILLTAFTIILINRLVCRDLLSLRRKSPTLTLDSAINIADYHTGITIKKSSSKSFPGDHATTAFMFAFSYAWYVRGRLGILAIIYACFLCIPRLAVGAHWFSDIIVGSGSIVLFSLTWAFFTPFADRCIKHLEKMLHFLRKS